MQDKTIQFPYFLQILTCISRYTYSVLCSLKSKMASHYETPRAVNRTAPQFKVLGCSKQKASPNSIMAYRAKPSGTIMASKRVEIDLQRRPYCRPRMEAKKEGKRPKESSNTSQVVTAQLQLIASQHEKKNKTS